MTQATRYWKVNVQLIAGRFLGGATDRDPSIDEIVPDSIPASAVTIDGFDVVGEVTPDEYRDWQEERQRGQPLPVADEEPDFDAEGANEWGGVIWVAHGEVDVVVAAENEKGINDQLLVAGLPTALDLTNFDGDPEVADWT